MPQRDLQAEVLLTGTLGDIDVVSASVPDTETHATSIDTLGMRKVEFSLKWASALTAGDVIEMDILESDDDSTFTVVSKDKIVPSRRQDSDQKQFVTVTAPTAPYLQTIGAFGTKRYLKVQLIATTLTADESATVRAALYPELRTADSYWDPDFTTQDGNP